MYYFKLHPSVCEFENDSKTVISAVKIGDNRFSVIINIGSTSPLTIIYTSDEILKEILNGYWVLTNEKGE